MARLDSDGVTVVKYRYDAWGKPTSKTGDLASTLGTVQPFRYRSYAYDEETGMYYLRSRYYSAQQCRFVNADRYVAAVGTAVKGYNLFAYCSNDPVNHVDSEGKWPKWLTGALNTIGGTLEVVAGFTLGATVGWTGIGAAAASALVVDGSATASQGIFQVINDVTDTHYLREDNVARSGVQAIGQMVAGDNGAEVAGVVYDVSIFAAAMYVPAKATQRTLQQAGKLPVRVPVSNIRNNPLDEFVTVGPKSGQISEYCKTLTRSNYGPIYVTELGNGLYQLSNGHHRVQAIRSLGWEYINVWITK